MCSLSPWRTWCSARALLYPNWLVTKRRPGHVSFSVVSRRKAMNEISFAKEDLWHSNTNLRALGKERKQNFTTKSVNFTRNFSICSVHLHCWNCKEPLDKKPAFFCLACKVVQPPEEGTSYFQIMDCDYTFTLDTQKLQKRYVQLQRFLHPDNFSRKSVKEQKYSETQSALVNKAYKTLLKPLSRGLYMLELQGMHIEEGTDSEADSEFLMELMEINETLAEVQTLEGAEKIGRDTKGKLADLTKEIDAALLKGDLHAAKALLAQMKYYANVEEKVKQKLTEFM